MFHSVWHSYVGRVQGTFLLNTEGRWFEFGLKSYVHTDIYFYRLQLNL